MEHYCEFVRKHLHPSAQENQALLDRIRNLNSASETKVSLLLTAALGLSGEAGEFTECVKKLLFHDRPMDARMSQNLCLELGDVAFYFVAACLALGKSPQEILEANMQKLEARRTQQM